MERQTAISKNVQKANASKPGTFFFQPKLTINQPNDSFEHEADAMADKVMRMTEGPANQDAFFKPAWLKPVTNVAQRKCQACEEEEQHVHRKEIEPGVPVAKSIPISTIAPGLVQRITDDQDANQDSTESESNEGSLVASETLCTWYASKFWLSQEEKDQQLFNRVLTHFSDQPDARQHLWWYRYGEGKNYDENVGRLLKDNPTVQQKLAEQIGGVASASNKKGSLVGTESNDSPIKQAYYDEDNWRNANGNIDEVDWELQGDYTPHGANTFKIKIHDPYQWHPLEARATQCLHEAMERLKTSGAKEYITEGETTVTLQLP